MSSEKPGRAFGSVSEDHRMEHASTRDLRIQEQPNR